MMKQAKLLSKLWFKLWNKTMIEWNANGATANSMVMQRIDIFQFAKRNTKKIRSQVETYNYLNRKLIN